MLKIEPDLTKLEVPKPEPNLIQEIKELPKKLEKEKSKNLNPFPIDVFTHPLQEIIKETNEKLNFPIDFTAGALLSAMSASIGNTTKAMRKRGHVESPVIYCALVGQPGTGKTHPLNFAFKPLRDHDSETYRTFTTSKAEYDVIKSMTQKEREEQGYPENPEEPFWKQILVSDFTPEALAKIHFQNKRGLCVFIDELIGWVKDFNRYSQGSEEQFWLSAYSGGAITINRKNSDPIRIAKPFIPVVGTIQPKELKKMGKGRTGNGFLDRILFFIPDNLEKEPWTDRELPEEVFTGWEMIVNNILNLELLTDEYGNPQPKILTFTADAKAYLYEWQTQWTKESNGAENEDLKGVYAKLESYVLRLSLILEVEKWAVGTGDKEAVTLDSVKGATRLVKYFLNTAKRALGIVNNEDPVSDLPRQGQRVYTALPGTFTTAEGVELANKFKMSERTFKRLLNDRKLFDKVKRGVYDKIL